MGRGRTKVDLLKTNRNLSKSVFEGRIKKGRNHHWRRDKSEWTLLWEPLMHIREIMVLDGWTLQLSLILSGDPSVWEGWCWQRMAGAGGPQEPSTSSECLQRVSACKLSYRFRNAYVNENTWNKWCLFYIAELKQVSSSVKATPRRQCKAPFLEKRTRFPGAPLRTWRVSALDTELFWVCVLGVRGKRRRVCGNLLGLVGFVKRVTPKKGSCWSLLPCSETNGVWDISISWMEKEEDMLQFIFVAVFWVAAWIPRVRMFGGMLCSNSNFSHPVTQ